MTTHMIPPQRSQPWLLPREHGAYAQVVLPLITSLAVGRVTLAAVLWTGCIIATFLAHESVLVLLGHRGRRARAASSRRAWFVLAGLTIVALGSVAIGIARAPITLAAAAIPIALAAVVAGFVVLGREKSLAGEIVVAAALSSASVPVSIAAGSTWAWSLTLALVWTLASGLGVLTVRGCIARGRSGGSARVAHLAGVAGAVVTTTAAVLVSLHRATWAVPLALLPVSVIALALAVRPASPRRLREVGWTLASASVVTLAVLIAGSRARGDVAVASQVSACASARLDAHRSDAP